ncbi:cation:dicarboxylase symporter family transporter [Cupriavidus taiwanensis]|uniref:dicarboxylate/amino acid:cation symporter n=1 Tax=Cupriavidus taiwanensis TaxID=164546 RepID=UPI0025402F8F|nr:cation:dicarboxylase symporter family transporter [Cupriavidus taiwanensis]MDK3022018.1 cation:dicarboxylase symporter family transporter [Cupriavidus taiwanensis]
MKALHWLSHSVPGLLACLVAGALAGTVAAPLGRLAWLAGQLYLSVVNMAAVPLLVVATFFGLRQVLALPRARARFGAIIGTAAAVVAACALAGALAGVLMAPGAALPADASARLGALILSGVTDGGEVRVDLQGGAAPGAERGQAADALAALIPDNFYRALAHGQTLGVLTGTLLFGLAFAALSREQTSMLGNVFEGIYRTFEQIIAHANLLIPVLAFGLAAHLAMHADRAAIGAMAALLATFLVLCLLLSGAAAAVIARCARLPLLQVVTELNRAMLVGLASGSATAPIPHTIEAMSARLGFPRGLVELVVPLGAVFVRGGAALYFALVTVFVANLYGRPITAGELAWITLAAALAAWLSAGQGGIGTIAHAGVALSSLQLPAEAAAVLLLAIDPVCDGPRNALSLVCTCAVIALVSVGLPLERAVQARPTVPGAVVRGGVTGAAAAVRLVLTRTQLALAGACALLAALLIVLMGIGVGAK